HQHGVIHRDIKPENILLHGGHAQVADFGIALAASKTGGGRMTETGMSLGTPHYMSPEQAMGERELDARTDVYALGCVTFEMLAGEPPFTGPTAQSIVAKVMTEEAPSARSKRATVPEYVDDAIHVALQKLPADRFRTAAEFGAACSTPLVTARRAIVPDRKRTSRVRTLALAGTFAATAAAAFLLGARLLGTRGQPPLVFGHTLHLTWDPAVEILPALSPDGRFVAYAAGNLTNLHVMVRPVGEGRSAPLTGDAASGESHPQWSPDGSRILFLARDGVFSAPAGGGPARPELQGDARDPIRSATWSPDGKRLAVTRGDSLLIREADESVHGIARMQEPTLCAWSPQGTFVACQTDNSLYAAANKLFGNLSPSRIVLCRVRDGALTTVTDSLWLNSSPTWSADGRWLYFVSNRDGPRDIYGVPIASDGKVAGALVRLSTGLGAHTISLAANGSRLTYSRYSTRTSLWSMPMPEPATPAVTTAAAKRITNTSESIEEVNVSPDGKWLLYDSDLTGNSDIFRRLVTGGEAEQLTTDASDDFAPEASPDGKEIAFHSWRSGTRDLYVMRLDGGGVQQVTHSSMQEANPTWSPDGKSIAFDNLATGGGIWIVRRDATGHWGEPTRRRVGGFTPGWSPDGKSLHFMTTVQGESIMIMPADAGPERMLIDSTVSHGRFVAGALWVKPDVVYYVTYDPGGNASIWSIPPAGGVPKLTLVFDAVLHPLNRSWMSVHNGTLVFPSDNRESDIWVMEVRKP
ncbi:MAG: protein kinase, partial [bacterium]